MGKLNQTVTGIAASFSAILMGCLNVWPSYTLELYTSDKSAILSAPMSKFEASLVGSLPSLGAMLGTAITSYVIDKLGRKRGVMFLVTPCILHWLIILFSSSATTILVARFVGGIIGGAYCVYAPIYVSEIAEPSIRGTLASGTITLYCAGTLISYLSGWFLSYGMIIWLNFALCALNLLLLAIVEESPVFLLKQNREQGALKALAHYRSGSTSSKSVLEELLTMKQQLLPAVKMLSIKAENNGEEPEKEKLNIDSEAVMERPKQSAIKSLFSNPTSRRAFMVVGTSSALQVLMGMSAVQVYAGQLFSRAAPSISSGFCSVLLAVVLFAGCMVAGGTMDKVGRRVLIISSSALVAACMGVLGFLVQTGAGPASLSAVVILVYCFCFTVGAGSVPYVLLAELFTSEVQGIASMILVEMVWLLNFALLAVFPFMASLLGVHGTFYTFSCVAIANTALSYCNLPETKGLSTKQIQELFTK